jgi:hypothetical protein
MPRPILLAALLAALALGASAPSASACSYDCRKDFGFLATEDGWMPLNARGVLWAGETLLYPLHVRVERLDDAGAGTAVPFTLQHLGGRLVFIRLKDDPKPGERYRFQNSRYGHVRRVPYVKPPWQSVTFTVSPEVLELPTLQLKLEAAPSEVVSLKVQDARWADSIDDLCGQTIDLARIDLRVVLPPEVEPFRQHLLFTTWLDGDKPWTSPTQVCRGPAPGRTWTRLPGTDALLAGCRGPSGLDLGPTSVAVEVAFPQASPEPRRTPAITAELRCPAESPRSVTPGQGASARP